MIWKKEVKPSPSICPEKFCFVWDETNKSCRESFGVCKRKNSTNGNIDLYEPCEPELKKADLPWFYFISSEKLLVEELREEYIEESRKLRKRE